MMRIGHGYDIHRFSDEPIASSLQVGGVSIPYERQIIAHSDGDVVIHALCDALLGALALGDIGKHFPDSDQQFKNIDSRFFLRHVMTLLKNNHYELGNADVSIIAQEPKMAPHIMLMRENLSQDLETSINNINIKATTNEGLDALGNKLGIAAHAVVLIVSVK